MNHTPHVHYMVINVEIYKGETYSVNLKVKVRYTENVYADSQGQHADVLTLAALQQEESF